LPCPAFSCSIGRPIQPDEGKPDDSRNAVIYVLPRHAEPHRDRIRPSRPVRHVLVEPAAALTATFLATTIATSVTGFFFSFDHLLPSHIVGIISLVALAISLATLYVPRLAGAWRSIYVTTAVFALYLNVFVLVAQLFQKVPAINALAPTQTEPPFAIAQGIVLLIFIALGIVAVRKFHPR